MSEVVGLDPVDQVEITTLYENLVDQTAPDAGPARRLSYKQDGAVVSSLLADERSTPFLGGHGISMLVRVTRNGVTRGVLFDTGGTPEGLVHNLDCLELDAREWSCVVLSHGHWDHRVGLVGLQRRMGKLNTPLTLHPDAFLKRATVGQDGKITDLTPLSPRGLRDAGIELIETESPSFVAEGMVLVTGQIDRTNDFETGWPAHRAYRDGQLAPDPLICDDQGLVINLRDRGLVVLSGCGHAGIINTVRHAQAVTGTNRVHAVIGGFHLGPAHFHEQIAPVVDALTALRPDVVSPSHCAGHLASTAVYRAMPDAYVQNMVGTRFTLSAEDAHEDQS